MLTHVDDKNKPKMVDVSKKAVTFREASAQSVVRLTPEIMNLLIAGDIQTKKGPVFSTAIIAGTMAVKKTSDIIPFCHPLPLDACQFTIKPINSTDVQIECYANTYHKTGIEMEVLCGASVAALTIYDMCKAMSHEIEILNTFLLKKSGGKSDFNKTK
ncbi:MAG: cyclic pyranopterin monophosphate synthase MoaC [Bdellovibrionaceae bacterium]|jgi:cyclic pyranopterin monophosphate synthase|nr:cyclic pyranopterin monophosphate synthase MoaC [Pseudobdellovibrionaceae bacterium]